MKFSVIIRGQHLQGEDMRLRMRQDLEEVRLAERLGYDGIAKGSHFSAQPFQFVQMIPFLARAAAEAPSVQLICGLALLPLHQPLDLAEQIASLDVISDGRVIFGVGLGYRDVEFKAFNTTRKDAVPRFEEGLASIKRLWTEDAVHEVGSHFTHDGAATSVRPIQRPHPPIWLGGGSEKAVRRAARMADSLYLDPFKTGAMIEALMPIYRRELEACNKPFPAELPIMREIFVSRHPGEAMRKAKPYLEIKYRAYDSWGQGSTHPANPLNRDFDELAKDRFLIGGRDEVIEQIFDLHRRTGINHLVLGVHWPGMPHELVIEQMQLLAEEIFPIIRA